MSIGFLTALSACAAIAAGQSFVLFDADPDAGSTRPVAINSRGDAVGRFKDGTQDDKQRAFVRDRNGLVTLFDADPAAISTNARDISNSGDVTGSFEDSALFGRTRGFVRGLE